jgi:quinol monooxygenase YgiN
VAGWVLSLRGRARSGRREELLGLFEEHLAPRAERNRAQRLVVWSADDDDGDAFELFEIYDDPAAARANAAEPWFAAYLEAAMPLLDGPPAVSTGTPRWVKGVNL